MPPLFPVTLVLHSVACTLYLVHVLWRAEAPNQKLGLVAWIVLALAFASQAADIAWLCMRGLHPVANAREAVFFGAWLMCGAYLAATWRRRLPVVGALVAPAALVLDVATRLVPSQEIAHAGSTLGTLGMVHIALATTGIALFGVGAGSAVAYIVAERRLKGKRKVVMGAGASLETLDRLNRRCITLGFPIFTVAMVTGAMWAAQLPGVGVFTPQYAIATAAWLLYAGLLLLRLLAGWRGRRAAFITLAGFVSAATVMMIYVVRGAA